MTLHSKSGDDESGTHTEFYDDNGIAHTTPRLLKKLTTQRLRMVTIISRNLIRILEEQPPLVLTIQIPVLVGVVVGVPVRGTRGFVMMTTMMTFRSTRKM